MSGGTEVGLGGGLSVDFGDATYAAMTNLEIDTKIGSTNDREEEEEEVYGIFTGNTFLDFWYHYTGCKI